MIIQLQVLPLARLSGLSPLCGLDAQIQIRSAPGLIFGKRVVRVTVQPALVRLSRSNDRMTCSVGMFAGVTVRRAIAAQRYAARLAGAQMDPV
jgi:hypothetical protein